MNTAWSRWGLIAVACVALACPAKRVSDTGYVGTWSRGGAVGTSTISIAKTGDQYQFTWKLLSADGKWTVKCDSKAHCIEQVSGRKTAEHQFTTRVDPTTGHLIVEGTQQVFDDKGKVVETRTDIDELILEEGNLKLTSYTIERNGKQLSGEERPQRAFEKVSDHVMGPGA